MIKKVLYLDHILSQGTRVYDVLSIITLSLGISFLTNAVAQQRMPLCSLRLWSSVIASILLILSGINFSWLSYWVRRYVEEIAKHSIGDAAQIIRKQNKTKEFETHSIMGWAFLILSIAVFLTGGIYG